MKKRNAFISCGLLTLFVFSSCSVKDEIDDSIQRVECASLLADFTDLESEERTCTQIIADVDMIVRECNEFLDQDTKDF